MNNGGMSRRNMLTSAGAATSAAVFGSTATASANAGPPRRGRVVEYWIQVDHKRVDTAPKKFDPMMGMPITEPTTYDALIYRAFSPGWHKPLPGSKLLGPNTGFPGPVLRANPGDLIRIHFRNNDTQYKQPHSMHPHGVRYTPANCGAWTSTNTEPGSAVPFGETYTYEWEVLASSVGTWPYHDHSKPFVAKPSSDDKSSDDTSGGMNMAAPAVMELSAQLGLMGMLVIDEHGRHQADREIYLVMHDLYAEDIPGLDSDVDCFNGRAFLGNTPTFTAKVGESVRWHIVAFGTEFHVFHLHGHRWKNDAGRWVDSQMIGPATTLSFEYVEDNPGDWLYHCHVTDHMTGGMVGNYVVTR